MMYEIYEESVYTVEAESAGEAVKKFLKGPITDFPCEVKDRYVTKQGQHWIEPVDPDTGEGY